MLRTCLQSHEHATLCHLPIHSHHMSRVMNPTIAGSMELFDETLLRKMYSAVTFILCKKCFIHPEVQEI
jgi:hypothetical protein